MTKLTPEQKLEIAGWLPDKLKPEPRSNISTEIVFRWKDTFEKVTDREWERVMWLVEETFSDEGDDSEWLRYINLLHGEWGDWGRSYEGVKLAVHATPLQRYFAAKQVKGRGGE